MPDKPNLDDIAVRNPAVVPSTVARFERAAALTARAGGNTGPQATTPYAAGRARVGTPRADDISRNAAGAGGTGGGIGGSVPDALEGSRDSLA